MPYEAFNDSDRYVSDAPQKKKAASTSRKSKPHAEWTIKDVVLEFRQRFHVRYPKHSPDELGNFQRLAGILGKYRKDEEVTVPQMIAAIDTFFLKDMAERYPNYPSWQKYLWIVRDQRDRNPEVHRNTMRRSSHEGAVRETALSMEQLKAVDPAVAVRRAAKQLALRRRELEHLLDEQRRYGDSTLEDELGSNWATILEELKKEVGYERPDDRASGTA